jgi:heptosyltransferase-2
VLTAPNWLGDAVMSLPALGLLAAAGVRTAVMTRPYTARVYRGVEGVGEVIVPAHGGRWKRARSAVRALEATGAEAVVLAPPSFSSALPPWLARVPVRVGYAGDGRSALLSDAPVTPQRGSEHLSESYRRLAQRALVRLGVDAPAPGPAPALALFDEDRAEAEAVRSRAGVGSGYAVVIPGATYGPAKSWPVNRFRDMVRVIAEDVPVFLAGGAAERDLGERVGAGICGVHNVAGETSLGGLFALAAGAAVVVANDSGAPHAAASLGAPTVVLFGSTSPQWTRPLGPAVTVLRHRVHCAPCFRRTCPTQLECFSGISVDEVVAAARRAMGKKGVA